MYLVVKSVSNYSDNYYNLPQFSLPSSDVHYSFYIHSQFTVLFVVLGKTYSK